MKRQTIQFPDHVASILTELATRANVSEAEIVRWAILGLHEAAAYSVKETNNRFHYVDLFRQHEKIEEMSNRG